MPVVDASVALKWFIEEPDSSEAIALRDGHTLRQSILVAPDLLIYEVANALLHNARFSESETARSIQALYNLQIELVAPTEELTLAAIRLATRHKLTFYDALYVAVAQQVGTELITADRHLLHRVSPLSFVRLLH